MKKNWIPVVKIIGIIVLLCSMSTACAGNTPPEQGKKPTVTATPNYGATAIINATASAVPGINKNATVDWVIVSKKTCDKQSYGIRCNYIQLGNLTNIQLETSGKGGSIDLAVDYESNTIATTNISAGNDQKADINIPILGLRTLFFSIRGTFTINRFKAIPGSTPAKADPCEHNSAAILKKKGVINDPQYYCLQWVQDLQPAGKAPNGGKITLKPNQTFTWKFQVKNDGTLPIFGKDCRIEPISQTTGEGASVHVSVTDWNIPDLQPGQTGEIDITFIAPTQEDTFFQTYEVTLPDGLGIRDEISILFTTKA